MEFILYNISKRGFFFPTYEITEEDYLVYSIKNKSFFLKNFVFYDENDEPVMRLKHVFSFIRTRFELYKDGYLYAEIKKTKGPFKNNFNIDSADGKHYFLGGNFTMKSFTLSEGDLEVAKISRRSMSAKNRYGIAASAEADQDLILGVAFAMEVNRILRNQKSG
ncbi:MAG: hypothetical protein HKO66_01845 [Saprospiraceae bacterium]|nr:hypothetical protein [Bacteroidia bacterium]NNE14134.1 hypothetical protein [Saprospiraceae bacterium]NNL90953.1 hypothetical protein [Saprospiraceae bacterium]